MEFFILSVRVASERTTSQEERAQRAVEGEGEGSRDDNHAEPGESPVVRRADIPDGVGKHGHRPVAPED